MTDCVVHVYKTVIAYCGDCGGGTVCAPPRSGRLPKAPRLGKKFQCRWCGSHVECRARINYDHVSDGGFSIQPTTRRGC